MLALVILLGLIIVINFVYPQYYKEYINKYGDVYSVDKNLIYAVVKAESSFQKNAISSKGAKGLMQIMEKTGDEILDKLDKSHEHRDLFDPEINIMVGTYYLSYLIERNNGDLNKALAAYNSGMENVKRWENTDRPFLDSIDYAETKNYIDRVSRYHDIYKFIYDDLKLGIFSFPDTFVHLKIKLIKIGKVLKEAI